MTGPIVPSWIMNRNHYPSQWMVTIHDHFHWPWVDHFKNATTCRTNGGLRELAKQLRDDIQVGLRVAHLTLQTTALDATVFLDSGDTGDIDVQQWKHGKWCILPTDLRIWRMDDFCWDMEAKNGLEPSGIQPWGAFPSVCLDKHWVLTVRDQKLSGQSRRRWRE